MSTFACSVPGSDEEMAELFGVPFSGEVRI
jgi:hypothetical protein